MVLSPKDLGENYLEVRGEGNGMLHGDRLIRGGAHPKVQSFNEQLPDPWRLQGTHRPRRLSGSLVQRNLVRSRLSAYCGTGLKYRSGGLAFGNRKTQNLTVASQRIIIVGYQIFTLPILVDPGSGNDVSPEVSGLDTLCFKPPPALLRYFMQPQNSKTCQNSKLRS